MGYLLLIYALLLLAIAGFGIAAAYHALKYGHPGDKTRLGLSVYLLVSAVIIIASFVLLGGADWSGEAV